MNNPLQTSNFFSEYTFDFIERWYSKYGELFNMITETDDYEDFVNYVEQPFIYFCKAISERLPSLLSFRPVNNLLIKNSPLEVLIIDPEDYDGEDLCLQAKFSQFNLLYIQLNQWGIKVNRCNTLYENLLHDAAQRHTSSIMKLLLSDPLILSPREYLLYEKSEILYELGFEYLVSEVEDFFSQYLPLLILSTYNDPLPVIHQYIYRTKNTKLESWTEGTGFDETYLQEWLNTINRKGQAIIYGSPGTGKTFIAQKIGEQLTGDYGFCELIQFHPAYSYEDFIQGIRPQSQDGKLTYPLVPGRFLEFCKKAESRLDVCVLIIDEINRANLAQVFGELMYLLEYRDREIPLAAGNSFRIPKNVRIIGTMNTADRSIAQIDHALRRRFAFIELRPNYDVLRRYHLKTGYAVEELIKIVQELNQAIADKNYEIGLSFFLTDNLRDDIQDIWQMEIEPYLEEYFFDKLDKVDEFRWDKIYQRLHI